MCFRDNMEMIRVVAATISDIIAEIPTTCEIKFDTTHTMFSVGTHIRVVSDNISIGMRGFEKSIGDEKIIDALMASSYVTPNVSLAIICGGGYKNNTTSDRQIRVGIIHGVVTCENPRRSPAVISDAASRLYPEFIPELISRTTPMIFHPIAREDITTLVSNGYSRDIPTRLMLDSCLVNDRRCVTLSCDRDVLDHIASIILKEQKTRPNFNSSQWCEFATAAKELGLAFTYSSKK